jgi:hypothetical protein
MGNQKLPVDRVFLDAFVEESAAVALLDKACIKAVKTKHHRTWCRVWVMCERTLFETVRRIREQGGLLLIGTNLESAK